MRDDRVFLSGPAWAAVLALFGIFWVLTPFDLVSAISGYSLAERRAEIDSALNTIGDGSVTRRMGVLALGLMGVVALVLSRRESRRYHVAVTGSASALLLLAFVSPLWGDDPVVTARRVIVLFVLVCAVYGFARWWDLDTLTRATLIMTGMSIVTGLVAECVLGTMHPLDPSYRFRGVTHSNHMGELCALFTISCVVLAKRFEGRRSAVMMLAGALGVGLLLLTKARGALIGTGAALAVISVLGLERRRLLLAVSASASAILGAAIFLPDFSDRTQLFLTLGRPDASDVMTLTGRTNLWHDLLQYAAARPILGYGYDSFWVPTRILEIASSQGWIIGSSHSGYLDVLMSLGGVGLTLFVFILASCLWIALSSVRRTGKASSLFGVAVLVWLCTNMITEVVWFEPVLPSFVGLMVVARLALREASASAVPAWDEGVQRAV